MPTALTHEYRLRKTFGKIHKIVNIPNLIQMQKESYDQFLQRDVPPEVKERQRTSGSFQKRVSRLTISAARLLWSLFSIVLARPNTMSKNAWQGE